MRSYRERILVDWLSNFNTITVNQVTSMLHTLEYELHKINFIGLKSPVKLFIKSLYCEM